MLIRIAQTQKLAKDPANRLPILFYSFHLPTGIQTNLDSQLQAIQGNLANANRTSACEALHAFLTHVQALSGQLLTPKQAAQLMATAQQIQDVLGC